MNPAGWGTRGHHSIGYMAGQASPRELGSCGEPGGHRKTMGPWWGAPLPPSRITVVGGVCWGAEFAFLPTALTFSQSEKVTKPAFSSPPLAFPDRVPLPSLSSFLHPFPSPQTEPWFPEGGQLFPSGVGRSWLLLLFTYSASSV